MKNIYLDGAANTPLDPRVFRAMKPFLSKDFVGNSFAIHDFGIKAMMTIEDARMRIARVMGFDSDEIFFTSGATESNNWVLKSIALKEYLKCQKNPTDTGIKKHLIVSKIEHSSIMSTCKFLEEFGFDITYLSPNASGQITYNAVKKALRPDTLMVCIMAVNNETGAVNAINAIGSLVHRNGSLMFSDCTQLVSLGGSHIRLGLYDCVDYFSFSAHKIYGPTGIGCLIARKGSPLYQFMHGGGQESGLRAGTSNTASIVGMAKAIELMCKKEYKDHYVELYNYLLSLLNKNFKGKFRLNVSNGSPNIVSINLSKILSNASVSAATQLSAVGIACSAGSACDSITGEEGVPSHVLVAQGLSPQSIHMTVRVSFTKYTTKRDIKIFIDRLLKLQEN